MKLQALLLGLLGAFAPSVAFPEYWISIGSFKNRDSAETALIDAQRQSVQTFGVLGSPTDEGYFFRVVAGPYSSQNQANSARIKLAEDGLKQGWILQSEASISVQAGGGNRDADDSADASELSGLDSLGFDDDWDSEYGFDEELDLGPEDFLVPESVTPEQKSLPEVPDTAPDGYQLNKLRREARAPPLEPLIFASTLSQTRPKFPDSNEPKSFTDNRSNVSALSARPITVTFSLDRAVALARRDQAPSDLVVDGKLDEIIWSQLLGADSFLVVDPDTKQQPKYQTLVKAFHTDEGLYVAIDMEQPRDTLIGQLSGRDARRINRDNVGVFLDTSGEGRYGYWLNVGLGGSQSDGTMLPERQLSNDWDGAWYSGTAVTASGWSAEMFLPWSQVAMPQTGDARIIKVYFSRKVAYLDERWSLPALPRTQPLFISAMQPLTLQRVAPVQQWSLFPYASSTLDMLESESSQNVGADLFWRPSTNFQATAAIKPDFGAVESDDVVVNLGAFETFFPEKRLFFQEGIEVFSASPRAERGNPITLLNTRRIGGVGRAPVLPDGIELSELERQRPVELDGALKTVGSIGSFRYGVLGASEADATYESQGQQFMQAGTDYGVARLLYEGKSDAGDYRALGFLSTLTHHDEQNTQAHGVDYHYLTSEGEWKLDGQFLFSSAEEREDGFGGFADVSRNLGPGREVHFGYSHFDEHLDINDLGFLKRNDVRGVYGRYESVKSDSSNYRQSNVSYWAGLDRNGEGDFVKKAVGFNGEIDLLGRDQVKWEVAYMPSQYEDLDSRGNGTYRIDDRHRLEIRYRTDRAKPISYEIRVRRDTEAFGGANLANTFEVRWRPQDNLSLVASARYVDRSGWLLWRDGINFATYKAEEWRPEIRLDYFLTAKHQFKLSSQWVGIKAAQRQNYQLQVEGEELTPVADSIARSDDFAISNLSLQLRYRWEIAPLSDLFVVYTLNGSQEVLREAFDELLSSSFDDPIAEQLAVKLRYRFGS